MTNNHKLALCVATAALIGCAVPGPRPIPSPPAITGEVLNWLGTPVYYRVEPAPLSKLVA